MEWSVEPAILIALTERGQTRLLTGENHEFPFYTQGTEALIAIKPLLRIRVSVKPEFEPSFTDFRF